MPGNAHVCHPAEQQRARRLRLADGIFYSSRRRHTRFDCDWSSDVCSSDLRGDDRIVPEIPKTIALSIAIGNPADGMFAARAIRATGGWAQAVTDPELVAGIRVLAEDTGVFAETAGGVTVAAALALARAGRLGPGDEVVLSITGHGLKTVEAVSGVLPEGPTISPKLREVAAPGGGRP